MTVHHHHQVGKRWLSIVHFGFDDESIHCVQEAEEKRAKRNKKKEKEKK